MTIYKQLKSLSLLDNKIEDIDDLSALKSLKDLDLLNLYGNKVVASIDVI